MSADPSRVSSDMINKSTFLIVGYRYHVQDRSELNLMISHHTVSMIGS